MFSAVYEGKWARGTKSWCGTRPAASGKFVYFHIVMANTYKKETEMNGTGMGLMRNPINILIGATYMNISRERHL